MMQEKRTKNMPTFTHTYLRQSDCLPPRPGQGLYRAIDYFYYGILRTTCGGENNIGNIVPGGFLPAQYSFIGSGRYNCIDSGLQLTNFSFVGGGAENYIGIGISNSSIVGGCINSLCGNFAFVGGGRENNVGNVTGGRLADFSAITAGYQNCIDTSATANSFFGFVGNGESNYVCPGSNWATVVNGQFNTICGSNSFIGSGDNNRIGGAIADPGADFSFIGSGQNNNIQPNTCHGAIFSGDSNVVSGNCSAILGGQNNNDNGNPYTGIYGTGISAAAIPSGTGAFWANELVVPNIPTGFLTLGIPTPPAGYPVGSLWYFPDANGNKVVYVV
jgi:hypothetical protein